MGKFEPLSPRRSSVASQPSQATEEPDNGKLWPFVSVVIPLHNDATTVGAAVESCLRQSYPGGMEVVIAGGASTDESRGAANALAATHVQVRVVDNPGGTTPTGLNRAIRASLGSVIVRCDARSLLPPGYIRSAVKTLEETRAANVGGIQAAEGETLLERGIALAMCSVLGSGNARYRIGGEAGPTDTVYLGVFRRSVIEPLGLFDERFQRNQDYELNWRIRASGETVFFDPGLRVSYRPRGSLSRLYRQYFEYGLWKRRMLRRHPQSLRTRQLAPPVLVLGLALSGLLTLTTWRNAAVFLPGLYTMTVLGAAAFSWWRTRDSGTLVLPVVYPTMHIGWGMGFLLGRDRRPLGDPDESPRQE